MPYFVYRIRPFTQLDALATFESFPAASAAAKALRADPDEAGRGKIKVVFAKDGFEAEDLLSQVREPGPTLGDD